MDVRIGFPGEYLAASTPAEYNHPIYATAIGLLLKGHEYLKTHNESMTVNPLTFAQASEQKLAEETAQPDPAANAKESKKKPSLLDTVRRTFSELFDEDDTKM